MSNWSVFIKLTEKEIDVLKKDILKNKDKLKEININGSSLLHVAVVHANSNLAKFVIDNHIDVNIQDEKGNTALHYCAEYNQSEIAKYILDHKGRLDIPDRYGNQPLWTATTRDKGRNDRIDIIRLFLKYGADKQHKNNVGKTPADVASRYTNITEAFGFF